MRPHYNEGRLLKQVSTEDCRTDCPSSEACCSWGSWELSENNEGLPGLYKFNDYQTNTYDSLLVSSLEIHRHPSFQQGCKCH